MMNSDIIQDNHDFSGRIMCQYFFQKLQKDHGIILFFFDAKDITRFIIQCTKQFDAFVLAECWDDSPLTLQEPRPLNRLVVADHGFIFKQNVGKFVVQ